MYVPSDNPFKSSVVELFAVVIATEFQSASAAEVICDKVDTETDDRTRYAVPTSELCTEIDVKDVTVEVDKVAVGLVVSIVTDVAADVTDSPSIVATAVMDFVPAVKDPVVHVHAPVVTFAEHVEPVFVPSALN